MMASTIVAKSSERVLHVDQLSKTFDRSRRPGKNTLWAVHDISIELHRGETLGLVGESGSGKSTLARCVLQLTKPTSGSVFFRGANLVGLRQRELRRARAQIGIVFQDPYTSLNPRWRIERIVRDPLDAHRIGTRTSRAQTAAALLEQVRLPQSYAHRLPGQLSGGERQRVAIARALALQPTMIICDEPTSALDVSVQAQILNLLQEIQRDRQLAILFISHNMAVVRRVSHRVAIMRGGRLVESGETDSVFAKPQHEYTQQLLHAIPSLPHRAPFSISDRRHPEAQAPPT
jgi:ABC-type glutathione transport system ATPase component